MFEVNDNKNSKENKVHFVLICDETRIFDAFTILKEHLGYSSVSFLSLVYSVPENYLNPLYKREIAILEKRFSHNLYTHILQVEPGKYDSIQECIETIINSNTNAEMQYQIFGNVEFVDNISRILQYLSIDTFSSKY